MGDYAETNSEITIVTQNEDEEETRRYKINNKCPKYVVPTVKLISKTIKKQDKILEFDKWEKEKISLRLGKSNIIRVELELPEEKLEKNDEIIKEYLFSLNDDLSIYNVYEHIIDIYQLSSEDISGIKRIYIAHVKNTSEIKEAVFKKEGNWSFAENGQNYKMKKDGDWSFIFNNLTIDYSKKYDRYQLNMTGKKLDQLNLNTSYLIPRVTEKIKNLQKYCI